MLLGRYFSYLPPLACICQVVHAREAEQRLRLRLGDAKLQGNQVLNDEISAWRDDGGTIVEADRMRKRSIRMLRTESHRVGGPPLSRFGPRHPVGCD